MQQRPARRDRLVRPAILRLITARSQRRFVITLSTPQYLTHVGFVGPETAMADVAAVQRPHRTRLPQLWSKGGVPLSYRVSVPRHDSTIVFNTHDLHRPTFASTAPSSCHEPHFAFDSRKQCYVFNRRAHPPRTPR
ncbi:hypothetical protein BST61_g5151 [Cercospora zeina]